MAIRRCHAASTDFSTMSVCPSPPSNLPPEPSDTALSLEWPNDGGVLAATTQQEHHRTPPMGCIRQIWSTANVMRHASVIGTSFLRGLVPSQGLRQKHRNVAYYRHCKGHRHPSPPQGNSLGLRHGAGGHPPGGVRDRGAHLGQSTTRREKCMGERKTKFRCS